MLMFVVPRMQAYQYDGTNAAEIAAAMGGWEYIEEAGNLVLTDPWLHTHTIEPGVQYCCNSTVYQTRAALEEYYYVLSETP